jgi:hypothetical protein
MDILVYFVVIWYTYFPRSGILHQEKSGNPASHQGDQIGRIFPCWAIFYQGSVLKNSEVARILGLLFSYGKSYVLISPKHLLGYVLGDFVANPSGHPPSHTHILSGKSRSLALLHICVKMYT